MLRVAIGPSPGLTWLLVLLYGGAVACVLMVPLPVWLQLGVTAGLLADGGRAVLLHARSALGRSIKTLEMDPDCVLRLVDGAGRIIDASLSPSSVVTPWLTVLNLRTAHGRRTVLLLPDRVGAEDYRRLRVLLRWRCRKTLDAPQT